MLVRALRECEEFVAGDGSVLRELLHPDKQDLRIRYSLAHAVVRPGQGTRLHVLRASEVYYVLEGAGSMEIDGERRDVGAGDAVYIPPGAAQRIRNVGQEDLRFLCLVDPAWRPELESVESGA